MEKRRQFLKKIFGFVAGVSISLTPAFSLLKSSSREVSKNRSSQRDEKRDIDR